MSASKSPLYSVMAVLVSLVVLAGGAAKLYQGIIQIKGSGLDPKAGELLKKSDASVAEANRLSTAIAPVFQELLGDFDKLGIAAFRTEKSETCAKLSEQFTAVNEQLQDASKTLVEATKHGTDEKTTNFLLARARSYELLVKVNQQNIDIIQATLDTSVVDMNTTVAKVMSIAANRDADQKAADEATAAADAILKSSSTEK